MKNTNAIKNPTRRGRPKGAKNKKTSTKERKTWKRAKVMNNPHKICQKNENIILPKLPYGWTKTVNKLNKNTRLTVMFRSPAKDVILTKVKLKAYLEEHHITHIDLTKFDFCPYNAGKECAKEQRVEEQEKTQLTSNIRDYNKEYLDR